MQEIIDFIRSLYPGKESISLHEPLFFGREKEYLCECVDSTFVSSVGKYVDQFENVIRDYTGAKYCVAVVNGTQALHLSLKLLDVDERSEVITQSATFVATANAIRYTKADCSFVDVEPDTFGMSPGSLLEYLRKFCELKNGITVNKKTGKKIRAVVPMHTFGFPCRLDEIKEICDSHFIKLVEDAAESLGSFYKGRHTGTLGDIGVLSFNGNKIITTGGGGMIVTDNEMYGKRAKHLSTTAKLSHKFEFIHDEVGYNFRMPNLNAAVGLAQMENFDLILQGQRFVAKQYREFFQNRVEKFTEGSNETTPNFWLNSVLFENKILRDEFLNLADSQKVQARTLWRPMHLLPMYVNCPRTEMSVTENIYDRLVNLPSTSVVR